MASDQFMYNYIRTSNTTITIIKHGILKNLHMVVFICVVAKLADLLIYLLIEQVSQRHS